MTMPQRTHSLVGLESDASHCATAAFELAGWSCRVVCREYGTGSGHDDFVASGAREVVHFALGDHCYALIAEPPLDSPLSAARRSGDDIHSSLTNRELQIVQLICMGLLTKQVANRLRLSEFTVRSYLKTIYCKLGVRSRGAMVFKYTQGLSRARIDAQQEPFGLD
jgi:DNA-binding CsgD family transcriptional regulator